MFCYVHFLCEVASHFVTWSFDPITSCVMNEWQDTGMLVRLGVFFVEEVIYHVYVYVVYQYRQLLELH